MDSIKNDILKLFDIEIEKEINKNTEINLSKIDNLYNNTSNIYRFQYNNENYICKIYDINKIDTRKFMGKNEFYFYSNLVIHVENIIKVPKFFGHVNNNNDEVYGLILEELNSTKINYTNINNNIIFNIIDHISKLHIFYWNKNIDHILNYPNNSEFIINEKIKYDIKIYFHNIKDIFEDNLYNLFNELLNKNHDHGPLNKTLIHGSLKIDNIIIINDIPYFIDWSIFRYGYGVEDILFLIIFSLEHSMLLLNYEHLLSFYLKEINKFHNYSLKQFNEDIKKSLEDFIAHAIMGLYIKNHYSKIKNNKIEIYLQNFLFLYQQFS